MAQTAQLRRIDTERIENEAERVFALQRAAYLAHPYPSLEERRERLRSLDRLLVENADAIAQAINADFGHRSYEETMMAEILGTVDGIRDTAKRLKKWMRPQRRHVSILFATAANRVIPQPKGVVGIVSPWNYPLFLTIGPLASIVAAGNRAMIKMATNSQHLCRLLAEKFAPVFPEDLVAILPGVRAQDFSTLPFDHLIFTGSSGPKISFCMTTMSSVTSRIMCGGNLRSLSSNVAFGISGTISAPFARASSSVRRRRRYDFSSITDV